MQKLKFFRPQAIRKYNAPDQSKTVFGHEDTHIYHLDKIYKETVDTISDSKIKKFPLWKKLTGAWTSPGLYFNYVEYLNAVFNLDFTFHHIISFVQLLTEAGGSVIMIYFLISIFVAVPMFIYYIFMAKYGEVGFIRFWIALPLLQGFAYSYITLELAMQIVLQVPLASLSLGYVIHSLIVLPKKIPHNAKCENASQVVFKVFSGFDEIDNDNDSINRMQIWYITTVLIWIVIYIALLMTMRRICTVLCKINIILGSVIVAPFIVWSIYFTNSFHYHLYENTNPLNPQIWIRLGAYLLFQALPGNHFTYAAFTKPGLSPQVAALVIYLLKILLVFLCAIFVSTCTEYVHERRGNSSCLVTYCGLKLFFGLIPSALNETFLGIIAVLVYFSVALYWALLGPIYSFHAILETLFDNFPKVSKYRLFICTGFCCVAGFLNILMVSERYAVMKLSWARTGYILSIYLLIIVIVASLLIYTLQRFQNDYTFKYATRLDPLWLFMIKCSLIFTCFLCFLYLYAFASETKATFEELIFYLTSFVVILPILMMIGFRVSQYRSGKMTSIIKPMFSWGCPGSKSKIARRQFDPSREFKYRTELRCKHVCLLGSQWLREEKEFWYNRRIYFAELLEQKED